MKNHLQPITKRAVTNYGKAPAKSAKKKHVNFTNAGDCGCTGKCDC
jgi:hypothetical protein